MAELTTLARPYAKAAFVTAQQAGALTEWSEALAYAAVVSQDPDMSRILGHPALSDERKAAVFIDICEGRFSEQVQNFVHVLAENKRLTLLPEIAELFEALRAQQERSVDVDLTSPFELTAEQQDKLAKALSAKLDRQVNLSSHLDKSLIGGVVIRAGDIVMDASVRGRLSKLADAIGS